MIRWATVATVGRPKITIVGAGNVGATAAHRLAQIELGDLVLVDILGDQTRGKALDLAESAPLSGFDARIVGTDAYDETAGSALTIITSGIPRKPGMSRDGLLKTNAEIVKEVTREIVKRSPNTILLVVSNPLDAMTYVAYKVSDFPRQRVMGMSGALDAARFRAFIAAELHVSVTDVQALVFGGHGDAMVPSICYATVAGIPVTDLMPKERLEALVKRTREGGAEIVDLLKAGSAYYAPAAAIAEMAEAIIRDKKKIIPCAALCEGEYGVRGLFVGVPSKLGAGGVEQIIQVPLPPEDEAAFRRSVTEVARLCEVVSAFL